MDAAMIIVIHKAWRLLNRKWTVTEARFAKEIGKTPVLHVTKGIEDAYGLKVEKTEDGYHLRETSAKAPTARTPKKVAKKK